MVVLLNLCFLLGWCRLIRVVIFVVVVCCSLVVLGWLVV